MDKLEYKLEQKRKEYQVAKEKGDHNKMAALELAAKVLLLGIEKRKTKNVS